MKSFTNFHIVNHPLIQHKLALLREKNTPPKIFKELVNEITLLLVYEATKNLPLKPHKITTPIEETEVKKADDSNVLIVPILRAGLGMVDGFISLLPWAKIGHIGLYRDEKTLEPHAYYFKIPKTKIDYCFVCDPMLATGGSAVAAIDQLKKAGIKNINFVSIVSAPPGAERLCTAHPDVAVYTACLDRELNNHGYIAPGLGDAGDRLFGTK